MVMESKPELTLEDKANILRENGFEDIRLFKRSGDGILNKPAIHFNGDQNEGQRAVDVLVDNGLSVFALLQVWIYGWDDGGTKTPRRMGWRIIPYAGL